MSARRVGVSATCSVTQSSSVMAAVGKFVCNICSFGNVHLKRGCHGVKPFEIVTILTCLHFVKNVI